MWGTIITDPYYDSGRAQMAAALEQICSPRDDYGFASGGVYCFWSLQTRLPLYIGRAVDLPHRFRVHNALIGTTSRGNKREQIARFFEDDPLLGYSILVRSPISQTATARRRVALASDDPIRRWVEDLDAIETEAEYEIAEAEGTAIRSFWLEHGELPAWNAIHGEATAWNQSMIRHDSTADLFCAKVDSLLQARRTVSELAREPLSMEFESDLQGARAIAVAKTLLMNKQLSDRDILEALDRLSPWGGGLSLEEMRRRRYLFEGPWVSSAHPQAPVLAQRKAWTANKPLPSYPEAPPVRLPGEGPW